MPGGYRGWPSGAAPGVPGTADQTQAPGAGWNLPGTTDRNSFSNQGLAPPNPPGSADNRVLKAGTMWETMSAPQRQWVMQMMGMMPQQQPGMPQPGMQGMMPPGQPGMMGPPGITPGAVPGTTNPLVNQLSGGGVGTMNPYMRQLLMQYMQQPPGGGGMGLQQPPMGNP